MKRYETIKVPFPVNANDEIRHLFSSLTPYRCRIPKIKEIKNAFVTHEGLVLKNGLLVDGCAFNLRGEEDNTFYYPFWRPTIEQFAVCRWGKSLPSIHLKGPKKYLLIHSKWFNYGFWINSNLIRLMLAEKAGYLNQVKLIVPEGWKNIPYVWDSLKVFDVEKEIIPTGCHMFVDNLVMPETREWTASFYPPHIQRIRERLIPEAIKRVKSGKKFPIKIYLTRSKRGVRCVENENQVIALLNQFGYETIAFEDFSVWEQIVMMSQATHFISLHGAGFSNVLFMPEGSKATELMSQDFANFNNPFPHWKLCGAAQLKYGVILGKPKEGIEQKKGESKSAFRMRLVDQNVRVNIDTFCRELKNV